MIRIVLPVLALSLFGITSAGAFPSPRTEQPTSTDLVVEVKSKSKSHHAGKHHGKNKGHYKHAKHGGKYYHGNRYWTHRYRYRPIGWRAYGCIEVGPLWYCP